MKKTITKLMVTVSLITFTTQIHPNIFKAAGNLVGDTGLAAGNVVNTTFTGERIEEGDRGPFTHDRYNENEQRDRNETATQKRTYRRVTKPYHNPDTTKRS